MSEKITIKRALLSCWEKTALTDLVRELVQQKVEIVSSGGTADFLSREGIPVIRVEEVTGFKEILDGRVKTLHPAIHAAILAKRNKDHLQQLQDRGIVPIDLVVVNLYPFLDFMDQDKSINEMIELIDIGGPTMLRAAAKNYSEVAVLHHPDQYQTFLEIWKNNQYTLPLEYRLQLAIDTFFHTSYYDAQISRFFDSSVNAKELPPRLAQFYQKFQVLRYGENPHQPAAYYLPVDQLRKKVPIIEQIWGKEMSYNNYLDITAAAAVVRQFSEPAVTIVKHTNPCGAAVDSRLVAAFDNALSGDPLSAYGGIVAANQKIERPEAEHIQRNFFECVLAPDYSPEALDILKSKKNLRILKSDTLFNRNDLWDFRYLLGGVLVQRPDLLSYDETKLHSTGAREPSLEEKRDLFFAWKIVQQVKSNAIVFAKDQKVVGVGAGQMSRVDSVKIACRKAKENGHDLRGAVMASDAFFPFRDGVDEAAAVGITAVIQPGGSLRDQEVIEAARQHQMAMLFTEIRHFKH